MKTTKDSELLSESLQSESNIESDSCPICFGDNIHLVQSQCKHKLCRFCYYKIVIRSNTCPLCRGQLECEEKRNSVTNANKNASVLMLHELKNYNFNADLFERLLDEIYILNTDMIFEMSNESNITGLKTLLNARCLEGNTDILNSLTQTLDRESELDAHLEGLFESMKTQLILRKQILPLNYILEPLNFTAEGDTIEMKVSEIIRYIAKETRNFSLVTSIRDLFKDSLGIIDLCIIIEATSNDNLHLLEYMVNNSQYDFTRPGFINFHEYWEKKKLYIPKKALKFLLERIETITDSEMILILKCLCTYDTDTEVFRKLLQKYGIANTLNKVLITDHINVFREQRRQELLRTLEEEQRNYLLVKMKQVSENASLFE